MKAVLSLQEAISKVKPGKCRQEFQDSLLLVNLWS